MILNSQEIASPQIFSLDSNLQLIEQNSQIALKSCSDAIKQRNPSITNSFSKSNQSSNIPITPKQLTYFDCKEDAELISITTIKNKNALKNLLKSFLNFLTNVNNSEFLSNFVMEKPYPYALKLVRKYFKDITFSNHDLIKILNHTKYSKAFEYYLTFDAYEWLSQSKVKIQTDHEDLITLLKTICASKVKTNELNEVNYLQL